MFFVGEPTTTIPKEFKTPLQKMTYTTLSKIKIPFERVDTDVAVTMDDCIEIDKKLNMKMVKTLFLCNRQKTAFYLFITTNNKVFSSKTFSCSLKISRVSFVPKELFEKMLGAATVFSILFDNNNTIRIIFDNNVVSNEFYGCSDGTTTRYMKIKTNDIINILLPYTKHSAEIIIM